MRIKKGFTLKKAEEHYIIWGKDGLNNIVLSEIDAFLWNLIEKENVSKTDMLEALLREFDISTVLALGNIDTFLRTMKEHDIIEE